MNSMETISVDDRELQIYVTSLGPDSSLGMLLVHAWWGFNECFKDICDRLAKEGFLVVAPGLYHGDVASTIDEADALSSELDAARAIEEVSAAFEYLRNHQRLANGLGVMAASMGVYYALSVVQDQPDDIDSAVLLYGTSDGEYKETSRLFSDTLQRTTSLRVSPMPKRFGSDCRPETARSPSTHILIPDTGSSNRIGWNTTKTPPS